VPNLAPIDEGANEAGTTPGAQEKASAQPFEKGNNLIFKVPEKEGRFGAQPRSLPGHRLLGAMGRVALSGRLS
jgi:hypothetical protein